MLHSGAERGWMLHSGAERGWMLHSGAERGWMLHSGAERGKQTAITPPWETDSHHPRRGKQTAKTSQSR